MDAKTLLMFGGARPNSVGAAIAKYFSNGGWTVMVCDKQEAIDTAEFKDDDVYLYPCDLMDDGQIRTAVSAAVSQYESKLSGMLYAAGYNRIAAVAEYTRENWETTLRLNLTAPFLCMQELMIHQPNPNHSDSFFNYVILGSNTSYVAKTKSAAYGASKAGAVHMAACMHRELAPLGYRVTVLNFGPVLDTDMDINTQGELLRQRGWGREEYLHEIVKNIPIKRFTKPIEIAEVAWLVMNFSVGELFGGRAINFDGGQQQG